MTLGTTVFSSVLEFIASQTAAEAKAAWPDGPLSQSRSKSVPLADYLIWVAAVEATAMLAGDTSAHVVQRLRRLYFSSYTVPFNGATGGFMDDMLSDVTTYAEPPLTTAHVTQKILDDLFSTENVVTARGLEVDVTHIWAATDFALNGSKVYGAVVEGPFLDTDILPMFTWVGDIGSAANNWATFMSGRPKPDEVASQSMMVDEVKLHSSKPDLLGDMDAVILAAHWSSLGAKNVIVSKALADYYADDAKPGAQAAAIATPNSARRFHHFLKVAEPDLGALGKESSPLVVTATRATIIEKLKPIIENAVDDLVTGGSLNGATISGATLLTTGGPQFPRLLGHLADFWIEGLASGDAPWPPSIW